MLVKGKSCTRAKLGGRKSQVGKFRNGQDTSWNRGRMHGQPGLRIQQQARIPAQPMIAAPAQEPSITPMPTEAMEPTAISVAIEQIAMGGPAATV